MKINLPTSIEVTISDPDLLEILRKKRMDLLDGADYAEQDEKANTYWLWKDTNTKSVGKPEYEKMREMPKLEYELLESITTSVYHLQKTLDKTKSSH